MTAAVETMAYTGQTPWHGLGRKLEENTPLEDFQREAGLDWTVSKRPVIYAIQPQVGLAQMMNSLAPGGIIDVPPKNLAFKDHFVLARDSDDKPYAVVSNRYKPVQPGEVFEFFRDLLDRYKMKMHTAGSLLDGKRIWCLAQTGDVHKVLGIDRVDSYLLLSTSYDLSLSTLAQFTSVRVVCNNTLQQALGDATGRVVSPHTQTFDADRFKDQLGIGREQWDAFTRVSIRGELVKSSPSLTSNTI
jgi:phage/plasmid-like protein (TIGR03299 family)